MAIVGHTDSVIDNMVVDSWTRVDGKDKNTTRTK